MSNICVICPSRDRPDGLKRLAKAVQSTSTAKVIAYVDDDQEKEYREACEDSSDTLKIHVGPRIGPVASVNAIVKAFPDFSIYGMIVDDAFPTTPSWDRWCLDAAMQFPNRVCVMSPAHNQGPHVDMPFVTREWINATGWYAYPRFFHFCWTTIVGLIGEMTAIVHAPQHSFFIMHDFQEQMNLERREEDAQAFFEFVSLRLPIHVHNVREAMAKETWRS